ERAMISAGRTAGISVGFERLATFAILVIADRQVTGEQEDFFPVIMHERLGREHTRLKAQQAGTGAALVFLIQRAGEDLLLDAGRVARGNLPSILHIERVKLVVLLVYRHSKTPVCQYQPRFASSSSRS